MASHRLRIDADPIGSPMSRPRSEGEQSDSCFPSSVCRTLFSHDRVCGGEHSKQRHFVTGTSAAAAGTHSPFSFTNIRSTVASFLTTVLPLTSATLKTVRSVASATFP